MFHGSDAAILDSPTFYVLKSFFVCTLFLEFDVNFWKLVHKLQTCHVVFKDQISLRVLGM